jgi:lipopolysaccharide/colanic/teichoic acid biosynthesis glycosyltransferase
MKRFIDIVLSALGLIFLLPFFGLMALLIALDSRGGVFYHQPRLGRNSETFDVIKFRTMYENADKILERELKLNPELKEEWNCYQKLKRDPRVTRGGRLLRRFSLDELPQLWNVLMGEMSLVGPRPITAEQCELYGKSYEEYVKVPPGMTGLWQVSGRNYTTFARRAELDSVYIQRWSIGLDIYILFKTIEIVFWQQGAF